MLCYPRAQKKTAPPEHRVFRRLTKQRFRQLFASSILKSSGTVFSPSSPEFKIVFLGGPVEKKGGGVGNMMKLFRIVIAIAGILAAGGCIMGSGTEAEPGEPKILLTLDRGYVPAVGRGFHWRVSASHGDEAAWNLRIRVNGQTVCGSEFGLPTDIYVGYWDRASAEFFFSDQEIPVEAVPVKITFRFDGADDGSASGFVFAPEGEGVFAAGDSELSPSGADIALLEFCVEPRRLSAAGETAPGGVRIRRNAADYVPEHSIAVFMEPALRPGQIPVGNVGTDSAD